MTMLNKLYILTLVSLLLLCGCSKEVLSDNADLSDAVELSEMKAEIVSGTNQTRAANTTYLEDNISRYVFEPHDEMVFTTIQRTVHPLVSFTYKDIAFDCNESGAWQRDKNTGYAGSGSDMIQNPERIYWSDAASAHTFIGYSKPRENSLFDWKKSSYCYDKDGTQYKYDTYYGGIGDPTNANEVIDYNKDNRTKEETITTIVNNKTVTKTFKYSQDLRDEDLLLTYDTELKADNSVANIKYYHALSSVRVIVNISGFYGTATDSFSVVSDMKLLDQPTMYRWKQNGYKAEPLINSNENQTLHQHEMWGEGSEAPVYNQRKDMILWNAEPKGTGYGSSRTFTFFGITVPQENDFFVVNQNKALKLKFKVTYPDPIKNDPRNKTISKWYSAEIPAKKANNSGNYVYFHPGQCTTIKITLNHKDENMTIGASYQNWQYVETPDEGNLKKKTTFLQKAPALADRGTIKVTIAEDSGATRDDATWLYDRNKGLDGATVDIVDVYGNDGTLAKPFTISTADQFLSFAYEVQSGRDFTGKYVKLDADITLQESNSLPMNGDNVDTSKLVRWIGIGTADKQFNGNFQGGFRHINKLYGASLFNTLGPDAIVDHLYVSDAIKVLGNGCIAEINKGIICGCQIEGDVESESESLYCGSIVGENDGVLIASSHIGKTIGKHNVGVILGKNDGIVAMCYNVGDASTTSTDPEEHAYAGIGLFTNRSIAYCCYYNSDLYQVLDDYGDLKAEGTIGHVAFPLTTVEMQGYRFVNQTLSQGEITDARDKTDEFFRHWSLNTGLDRAVLLLSTVYENQEPDEDGNLWFHQGVFDQYNPMPLKQSQVKWLIDHYKDHNHQFKFVPISYPKLQ